MSIHMRLGVFFIWVLAVVWVVVNESIVLSVLAVDTQWPPAIHEDAILNVTASETARATRTCTRLRKELGSDIIQMYGEKGYMEAIRNPASLFNSVHRPACVAMPRIDAHVQRAMAMIYQHGIRYAVMSGGHTGMTGWNTVQGGILIFFGKMKNITYDGSRDRATIQPGVRWGEALGQLEPYGVAPMGGRLGNIGTGLLLGGGVSYLAPENGWSTDGITEMDVVLVDGRQVTVNANNSYSDLFRALKGGGNRFGIVTRFEVEPIPVGRRSDKNWYGGVILYPESSAEALIRAVHKFVQTNTDPKAALFILGYAMQNGRPVASHTVAYFYRGSSLPRDVFGDFLDIPHDFQSLAPVSYIEAANVFGSGDDREFGHRFSGTSFAGEPERCLKAYRDFRRFAFESAHAVNSTVFGLTPITLHQIEAARKKGGNALQPALRPYLSAHWHTVFLEGQEQIPTKVELGLKWLMERNPPSPGAPLDMNESDGSQNVYATYGDYEFLRHVYQKYDPTRFSVRYSQGPIGL